MIEIVTCDSGDWVIVRDGCTKLHEGHSIMPNDLKNILKKLYLPCRIRTISDTSMESEEY